MKEFVVLLLIVVINFAMPVLSFNSEDFNQIQERLQDELNSVESIYVYSNNDDFKIWRFSPVPHVIIAENFSQVHFIDMFNKNIFVYLYMEAIDENLMALVDSTLRRMRYAKICIVLNESIPVVKNVASVLQWCHLFEFFNVILFWRSNKDAGFELFSYMPFPEFKLQNITTGVVEYFPNKMNNLFGYKLKTLMQNDPPRTFRFINEHGSDVISGHSYKQFENFFAHINGSMEDLNDSGKKRDPDLLGSIESVRNRTTDFSITLTKMTEENVKKFQISNPVLLTGWNFFVPASSEIPQWEYLYKPFGKGLGFLGILSLIYLTLVQSIVSFITTSQMNLSWNFCKAITRLTYYTAFDANWEPFSAAKASLLMLSFLIGFILFVLYTTFLSSFFATTVYEDEINNVSDIIVKKVPVLISQFYLHNLPVPYANDLGKLVRVTTSSEYMEHLFKLDATYCYPVAEDYGQFYFYQQKRMRRLIMRFIPKRLNFVLIGFPFHIDSPYVATLNQFLSHAFQAGLIRKWLEENFQDGIKAGIITYITDTDKNLQLTLEHFYYAWCLIIIGLSLSLVVFLIEIFY